MKLKLRLTLLLGLMILGIVAMAGFLTRRAVLEPFARELNRAHLEQVMYLAQQVDEGADPSALGERLGLELRWRPNEPRILKRLRRGGRCEETEVRGRSVVACRGPRGAVATRSRGGWLVAWRSIDPDAPKRGLLAVLAAVGASALLGAFVLASVLTRPLKTSVTAMERMASGDLDHRLPEGPAELGEVARAFNRMADRIAALLAAERLLMAGISHELRTPLARLRLELELLSDHGLPEKRLASMEADLCAIDRLIGEVLDASRLSLGERMVATERLDLRSVAEEALSVEPLPDHEIRFEGTATPVRGDRTGLVRVVRNLLENAGKYAPADSTVTLRLDGGSLTVLDEGPGVGPEDLPRLFDPFFRGAQAGATAGHGLGLMLARQIIERHGGTLVAENRPEGGLAVRLALPDAG